MSWIIGEERNTACDKKRTCLECRWDMDTKKGKLLISHRYDHIPLLDSSPGGVCGSWSYKTYPSAKVRIFCIFAKKIGIICDFVAVFREPGYRKSRLDRIWRAERQRVNEWREWRRKKDCLSYLLLRLQSGQRRLWFPSFSFSEMPSGSGATFI